MSSPHTRKMTEELVPTQLIFLWRWLGEKILVRVANWLARAATVVRLGVATCIYLMLLFVPELCSITITIAAYFAYKLAYRVLFIAADIYFLAMRLADISRWVRNLGTLHEVFEY